MFHAAYTPNRGLVLIDFSSMLIPEMLLNTQDNKKRKSSSIIDEWSETGVRRVDLLHQDGSIFTVNLEVLR